MQNQLKENSRLETVTEELLTLPENIVLSICAAMVSVHCPPETWRELYTRLKKEINTNENIQNT